MEYLSNLLAIAEVQIKTDRVKEACETIEIMIPKIEYLRECAPEVRMYTRTVRLLLLLPEVQNSKVQGLIDKAEVELIPYRGKEGYSWLDTAESQIAEAKDAFAAYSQAK